MKKKIVYILTWFPMFSESFVYNEVKHLLQEGCDISHVVALHTQHDAVSYDLSFIKTVYPPPVLQQAACFIMHAVFHPVIVAQLIAYTFTIHRGDIFRLRRGYTSFLKVFLLLPLILWINKQLGCGEFHFHAHFTGVATSVAMLLAKLRKASFSFTGHGSDVLEYCPKSLSYRINMSNFFITVSEYNRRYIIDTYRDVQANKIHVIPAVVDTEIFKNARRPVVSNTAVVNLVTVARLSPEKGHEVFLRALARFSREHDDFCYTVIGDGELRSFLRALVNSLGIEEKVKFLGFCNRDTILKTLQNSHLFVLTSYREGLPVGLMEALAAGLPVFATRITAVPEIVEHEVNGILVEAGDEESMFQGLQSLAAHNWKKLFELAHRAFNKDNYHFYAQNTIPMIRDLMISASEGSAVSAAAAAGERAES